MTDPRHVLVTFKFTSLYYSDAKTKDLCEYLNFAVIRGELVVQFWLRSGDSPVDWVFDTTPPAESIPWVLKEKF